MFFYDIYVLFEKYTINDNTRFCAIPRKSSQILEKFQNRVSSLI